MCLSPRDKSEVFRAILERLVQHLTRDQTAALLEQPLQQHLVKLEGGWARNNHVGDDALNLS